MLEGLEAKRLISSLEAGLPPPPRLAASCLVGLDTVFKEWRRDLESYVALGGSLLRIVVAPAGSGKTHLGEALKAVAAEKGFLVCKVDAQAHNTGGDDLLLYSEFCRNVTLPAQHLGDSELTPGLRAVLEDVAERMTGDTLRDALRGVRLPIPTLRETLAAVVDSIRSGAFGSDTGWSTMLAILSGDTALGTTSLTRLRASFPEPFSHLKRRPGKRDARLWLESLLLALRPLGFPGVMLVLDEHDDARTKSLDQSIVQLRQQLDRLAEGHLPGAFVLYLVLDDFPSRVATLHAALDQRLSPLLPAPLPGRLMADLATLRDLQGKDFLTAIGARLYEMIEGSPPSAALLEQINALATTNSKALGGVKTRSFVKSFAQLLDY